MSDHPGANEPMPAQGEARRFQPRCPCVLRSDLRRIVEQAALFLLLAQTDTDRGSRASFDREAALISR
jgi:hypothetical protein